MKKFGILTIILAFVGLSVQSQFLPKMTGSQYCSYKKTHMARLPSDPYDPEQNMPHSYDVLNYSLNLNVYHCYASPYPKDYRASNIITFRVDSTLNSIKLDANSTSLTIDSVRMAGVSFTHTNNILTIQLNQSYNPNQIVQVKVNYHHNNIEDSAFYASRVWYSPTVSRKGREMVSLLG